LRPGECYLKDGLNLTTFLDLEKIENLKT
jgi:hypothetical protein